MADVHGFLASVTDYEKEARVRYNRTNFDLENLRELLAAIGDPHRRFRSIHIAGTKGKGSTAIMTARILQGAGYSTGLYTSPHLVDMRERIQIDEDLIDEKLFIAMADILRRAIGSCRRPPTYFDVMTSIAFLAFAERRIDFGVIETGLGGRLDSTNVLSPAAVGITRIDYDHTDKLGTTLAAIAGEKAGIIKRGVPVVSAPQRPSAMAVIRRTASALGSLLAVVGGNGRSDSSRRSSFHRRGNVVECGAGRARVRPRDLCLPVIGQHQIENAAVAVRLATSVADLRPRQIRTSLASVVLPGRIETVATRPRVVVDVAHNPVSLRALTATARKSFSWRRCILIFGCLADKNVRAMTRIVLEIADVTVMTTPSSRRAVDARELAAVAARMTEIPVLAVPEIGRALDLALTIAREDDMVLVAGSFYLAGDVLKIMRKHP